MLRAVLRVRMSDQDAHYGGGLVDGARILALFGDAATELCIRSDGDEGLLRAYEAVEFLAPTRAGDFLEVEAEVVATGRTSRTMRFEARRVIAPRPDLSPSAAEVLRSPVVVCRARGTCVIRLERQRQGSAGAAGGAGGTAEGRTGMRRAQGQPDEAAPARQRAPSDERGLAAGADLERVGGPGGCGSPRPE